MQVTSHKEALRLGRTRFAARSLDDRAGTAALVRAVNQINPDRLPGRVIFAWSVHEEGGLRGAIADGSPIRQDDEADLLARHVRVVRHAARVAALRVRAARERPRVPRHRERERVARRGTGTRAPGRAAAGIPLQMGLTQGGTDGTVFTFWGAPNQGLSWPGRYSHSPGEVLDLRDLDMLTRLVVAVASARE